MGIFELVTSQAQIGELARVLAYDRLKSALPPFAAQKILDTIGSEAKVLENLPSVNRIVKSLM